jgi:ribosome-binding factor A
VRTKKPYHKRKPLRQQIETLCAQAWPDDGIDPRYDRSDTQHKPAGRKALQLCAQVRRALDYALAAECGDPLLVDLEVVNVTPAPNSGRLLVTVRRRAADAEELNAALRRAVGKLRCAVAAAINRKMTPELAFCVVTG